MTTKRKEGYIEKFLKKADKAIEEGIRKADEALEDAVEFGGMAANQAKKTSDDLRKRAKKESEEIKTKGIKKINESIDIAKNMTSKTDEDLQVLEKLGELRKAGVLTEKEFQQKKKKILEKI